ncbi:MAG: retropepsin-like domain-containing protein [Gemmatimonadota bacterium]|nr:retropepsin-like domain-containing protein [Gemmatimonadota bacterium]
MRQPHYPVIFCALCTIFACGTPGNQTPAEEPLEESGSREIPFDFERNQIILTVSMNDEGPFYMFLDTGGNPSAVDLTAAREAGIPLDTTAAGEAEGVGGEPIPIYAAQITTLRLGETVVGDVDAVALSLNHISARLGRPLHGVLGYSLLKDRIVQIDYRNRRIRIFADQPPEPQEGSQRVSFPLQFRAGSTIPLLEDFYVNGQQLRVTLDTGSSLALELFPWAIEQLGLEQQWEQATASSVVGARGEAAVREGRVESVRIGSIELGEQPVVFAEKERDDSEREGGNLGNALLKHFLLTLDYKNGEVQLELVQQ